MHRLVQEFHFETYQFYRRFSTSDAGWGVGLDPVLGEAPNIVFPEWVFYLIESVYGNLSTFTIYS